MTRGRVRRLLARLGLAACVLLAALLGAEALLPSPLDPWIPPLLARAPRGRVEVRAGADETHWTTVTREPDRPRIVWMGASTIVGVPYEPVSSPPRWLQLLLDDEGVAAEVVPVAAQGRAARDLLAWLPEVLDLKPTAVVLSTGHNESLDAERLLTTSWLRRSALLAPLCRWLGVEPEQGPQRPDAEHAFDPHAIAGAFRDDLARARALCADAGVPLLLCLPVSNLADCPPVLGDSAYATWDAARARLEARDVRGALPLLLQARDQDEWPARATSRLESVMRLLGPPLVDVPAALHEATAGRPAGFNLFMDHCHPTLGTQRLMALAVLESLREQGLLPARASGVAPLSLEAGLERLAPSRTLERTARVRSLQALLHLAFLGSPGNPMVRVVQRLVRNDWLGVDDPVTAVLLAVLVADHEQAHAALLSAGPAHRRELARLGSAYPWVAEAFARVVLDPLARTPAPDGELLLDADAPDGPAH